jgi:hypothetical protein
MVAEPVEGLSFFEKKGERFDKLTANGFFRRSRARQAPSAPYAAVRGRQTQKAA